MTMSMTMEVTRTMVRYLLGMTIQEELADIAAGLPTPFAQIGIFIINLSFPFFMSIGRFIAAFQTGDALFVVLEDRFLQLLICSTIALLIFLRRRPLRALCAIGGFFAIYFTLIFISLFGYEMQTEAAKELTDFKLSMFVLRLKALEALLGALQS